MVYNNDVLSANNLQIIPNKFIRFNHKDVTLSNFYKINKHPYTYKYIWSVINSYFENIQLIIKQILKT